MKIVYLSPHPRPKGHSGIESLFADGGDVPYVVRVNVSPVNRAKALEVLRDFLTHEWELMKKVPTAENHDLKACYWRFGSVINYLDCRIKGRRSGFPEVPSLSIHFVRKLLEGEPRQDAFVAAYRTAFWIDTTKKDEPLALYLEANTILTSLPKELREKLVTAFGGP